jgi:hypothetical protein
VLKRSWSFSAEQRYKATSSLIYSIAAEQLTPPISPQKKQATCYDRLPLITVFLVRMKTNLQHENKNQNQIKNNEKHQKNFLVLNFLIRKQR